MDLLNKTFLPTQISMNRNWYIIDCTGQTLGRLSTIIVSLLKGKQKVHYHPSVDVGDYIILINADLIILNEQSKHYFVYKPGRPGHSLKIRNVINCLSTIIIQKAVKQMLSKTEAKRLMRRLKIYTDKNHKHNAQKPIKIDLMHLSSSVNMDTMCLDKSAN